MIELEIANGYFQDYLKNPPQGNNRELLERLRAVNGILPKYLAEGFVLASSSLEKYPAITKAMGFPSVTKNREFLEPLRPWQLLDPIANHDHGPFTLMLGAAQLGTVTALAFSQDIPEQIPPEWANLDHKVKEYVARLIRQTQKNLGESPFTLLLRTPDPNQEFIPPRKVNQTTSLPLPIEEDRVYSPKELTDILGEVSTTHLTGDSIGNNVIPLGLAELLVSLCEGVAISQGRRFNREGFILTREAAMDHLRVLIKFVSRNPGLTVGDMDDRIRENRTRENLSGSQSFFK